jgi:ribosome-associated heat shock protein Hsp15
VGRIVTDRPSEKPPAPPTVRLDVWLWATRFFKTRALAKIAIEAGRVEIDDSAAKPARLVRIGDRVRVVRGEDRYEIAIVELIDKRAAAAVAQRCYRESDESRAARESAAEQRRLAIAGYQKPLTKPDKRARRLIVALGDIDAL